MKQSKLKEMEKTKLAEERRQKRESHKIDSSGDWKLIQNEEPPAPQMFGKHNFLCGIYANKKNRRGSDAKTKGVGYFY